MGEFGEDVTVTAAPNAREFAGRIAQDGSINNPPSTYAMKNYLPSAKAASTSTKAITLSRKQSDQNRGVAFPPKKPSGGLDHQVSIDVSEARTEDDTSESSSRRNSIERNTASSTPAASDMEEALAELDDDFMARLPSARVIPVEEGAELSDQSTSIVLPCAPDDTEKVRSWTTSFRHTYRLRIVVVLCFHVQMAPVTRRYHHVRSCPHWYLCVAEHLSSTCLLGFLGLPLAAGDSYVQRLI